MRVEGFVSTFAQPLDVEILDIEGAVTWDRGRGTLRDLRGRRGPLHDLGAPAAAAGRKSGRRTHGAARPGRWRSTLADSPPWLSLANASAARRFAELPVQGERAGAHRGLLYRGADVAAVADATRRRLSAFAFGPS